MSYTVRTELRPCRPGTDGTFYLLEETTTGSRAEIWPALGFNCVSWTVPHQARLVDWLWSTADLLTNPRPTRSGIPILFPFPNRIRGGCFAWRGRIFQLPINDSQQRNAIHGFACQRPWRVVGQGADENSAWLHGQFQASADAAECRSLWPADYVLDAVYRLQVECVGGPAGSDRPASEAGPPTHPTPALQLEVTVTNPDTQDLPFGFGLHPYFRLPAEKAIVRTPPLERYVQQDCLPTGERVALDGQHLFLTQGRPLGIHEFDDLYGLSAAETVNVEVSEATTSRAFRMSAGGGFDWLVVFTPPHRQAICVEPYTCVTDPFDTVSPGQTTGLQVLPSGGQWQGRVRWLSSE